MTITILVRVMVLLLSRPHFARGRYHFEALRLVIGKVDRDRVCRGRKRCRDRDSPVIGDLGPGRLSPS